MTAGDLVAARPQQRLELGRRRRRARAAHRTAAGGRASGTGRCRRPRPLRSCRRGRRSARQTKRVRSVSPRCAHHWNAIFSAISTAVAAAVGVEHAPQSRRRDRDQPLGELDRRRVREAEHRRVGDPVQLRADRVVDRGMAMAVDVAPQRRDAVDVARCRRCRTGCCPPRGRSRAAAPPRTSPVAG